MNRTVSLLPLLFLLSVNGYGLPGQEEPLAVVATTPKGPVASRADCRAILVTFNQPMVPLQALAELSTEGPLVIAPPTPGIYRWLGTTTLAFAPKDTLPYATRFTVKVPAGITSVSGASLAQDVVWEFETPRPELRHSSPEDGAVGVLLETEVVLYFNMPMSPARATPFLVWRESKSGRAVQWTVRHPTSREIDRDWRVQGDSTTVLVLSPKTRLRRQTSYEVVLREGLLAAQGELGLTRNERFTFQTYGDLRLLEMRQQVQHNPQEALSFKFSNPVTPAELVKHIHFTPPVEIPESYFERSYPAEVIELWLPLLPDTTYQVALDDSLADIHGNRLPKPVRLTFSTGPYPSTLIMTSGPGVMEALGDRRYPMEYVNLPNVQLQLARILPDSLIPLLLKPDLFNSTLRLPGSFFLVDRLWKLPGKRNERKLVPINVDWVLAGAKHGLVFLQVDNLLPDPRREVCKALLQVTELGVTAKFAPHDVLVYVTRLADASPVAGAVVELRGDDNRVYYRTVTDAQGLAVAPGWRRLGIRPVSAWEKPRVWVLAYNGRDVAYTASDWGTGIYPYRFGIDYDWRAEPERYAGVLFTDRNLYRAGDTAHVKVLVREKVRAEWEAPAGLPAKVKVYDSRGQAAWEQVLGTNAFGSLAFDYPVPPDAPLGYYRVTVDTGTSPPPKGVYREPLVEGVFRVEAFRPAECEVNVRPDRSGYVLGDTLRATVSGSYLFGGAMSEHTAEWWVRVGPGDFSPSGYEGYFFGVQDWMLAEEEEVEPRMRLLNSGRVKLDKNGTFGIATWLGGFRPHGASQVSISADVESASRQHVSTIATAPLHPGEYYIGIQLASTVRQERQPLTFRVITVDPDGKPIPNRRVRISLVHRQYHSVRKAGIGGRYEWISKPVDTTVDSAVVLSATEAKEVFFVPEKAGSYFIRAEAQDRRGNIVSTWAPFYVSGKSYAAWERRDDDLLELVPERPSYRPGEVATILVKSPFEEAQALVTVERETVLRHFVRQLKGTAPRIELPITTQDLPNVFVSVILLKGRTASHVFSPEGADVGRPAFKVGYVGLTVDPGTKHLNVQVRTDRVTYRPGEEVTVNVRLRDGAGLPARGEVALAVVDAAVLSLTKYRLPDPFAAFYGPRPLSVQTAETRLHVVEQRNYGEKGEDRGGDGGAGAGIAAQALRSRFVLTPYWNPSLLTDERGEATVTFRLPDNLTRFVVMAVAHTSDSRFGAGESELVVNKDLLVQPALPRFARVGDMFEAGAVVHNQTAHEGRVQLSMSAQGLVLKGKASAELVVGAGQAKEVRFPVEVRQIGEATVTFVAEMGALRDAVRVSFPLQAPHPKETVATAGRTALRVKEAIVVPADCVPGMGTLEVWLSSSAMTELASAAEYLLTYPYGCLEQRVSAVLPMIVAGDLVRAFRLPALEGADFAQVATQTLREFKNYQLPDGGFAYWPGETRVSPFVSAYAMQALVEARARGYPVDDKMFRLGIKYLREFLREKYGTAPHALPERSWLVTKALAAYVLAKAGEPDKGYLEYLYEQRTRLPLLGKAMLLRALWAAGLAKDHQQALADFLQNAIRVDPTTAHFEEERPEELVWIFHSDVRTTAVILEALLETRGGFPLDDKAVAWLLEQRKNGPWRTTQENVFALMALARYFAIYEKDVPNFKALLRVGERTLLSETFAGRELSLRRATLGLDEFPKGKRVPVDVEKSGTGQLYYGLRMNYFPAAAPSTRDQGITVLKTITPLSGRTAGLTFAPGALLKVELKVITAQGRPFVVVDDPLPAGLEAVNVTLETASAEAAQFAGSGIGESSRWGEFDHVELRDDRVVLFANYLRAGVHTYTYLARATTVGDFGMPSTYAGQMYEPEVFGTLAGARVTVRGGQ
ncbi:MAG: MG2 domain-containing protein [candidate division KSB1 bacterium]|nr:MG2 domain-containing protein [candidate division KSB1 bacterium]